MASSIKNVLAVLLVAFMMVFCSFGIPAVPHFFTEQLVDHFSIDSSHWAQRYYMNDSFFTGGRGSPIFVIMGGEDAIPPSTGLYYPYIVKLAGIFGALVIEPEHRFYGVSVPTGAYDTHNLELLTPQQALADTARFIDHIKMTYNSTDSPVLTIGGSYPGWLSYMMRLRYPEVVDFAYAASAPTLFYCNKVDQYAYYKKITESAETASTGCADAVRGMFKSTLESSTDMQSIVTNLDLCDPLPSYITDVHTLIDAVSMVTMYTFADLNMGNYPPPDTSLRAACQMIQSSSSDSWGALQKLLKQYSGIPGSSASQCYDLSTQLPAGANATISSGDWTGVGTGQSGASWDYETSTLLIDRTGTNGETDMFVPRKWTIEWLQKHAESRFSARPRPLELSELWGFCELDELDATHFIFTNGDKDGWSTGGVHYHIPEREIYTFDLPNGAHHSDLLHKVIPYNTPDVIAVHHKIEEIVRVWLNQFNAAKEV